MLWLHRLRPPLARSLCTRASGVAQPRLTKIVATIGPASEQAELLQACVDEGIDVMRVNFSHATPEEFHLRRTNLRSARGGEFVPVMLDTKGPEIRMGGLAVCKTGGRKAKITLETGRLITLTTNSAFDGASDEKTLYIGYPLMADKVTTGTIILLDDGLISLRVTEVMPNRDVVCEILNTSAIGERKGVNLPGIITELPPLSEKDKEDIRFGIEHDIDAVAASFVRNAEGVRAIRAHIAECHAKYASEPSSPPPLIISKIESTEALDNLDAIIAESDGLMVARGDLGVEVPIQEVVTWQKTMVAACAAAGKPVIVATQMLDSMSSNPRPTRAEVADVTNAVLEQADAVMLSGESANGKYPVEAVAMQAAIISHTEAWARDHPEQSSAGVLDTRRTGGAVVPVSAANYPGSLRAAHLAWSSKSTAILVAETGTGEVARAVAACKPNAPIVVFSSCLKVCRQLALSRAVRPVLIPRTDVALTPSQMAARARELGFLAPGTPYVTLEASGAATAITTSGA